MADTYHAAEIRTSTFVPLYILIELCDEYFNPRGYDVGGAKTIYRKVVLDEAGKRAKLCLERYNEKNNTNYILVEVVKLNAWDHDYYMIFTARLDSAGTEGLVYFRGAVDWLGEVLFCQIKEDGDVGVEMPPGHDEDYDPYAPENQWRFPTCTSSDEDDSSIGVDNCGSGLEEDGSAAADANRGS